MRERVSTILGNGKLPVLLIAPHGADDSNTGLVAQTAAKKLNCFAVINWGFERAATVDVDADLADCNRVDHCKEEVVYDEFLKPIQRFKDKLFYKQFHQIKSKYDNDPLLLYDPVAVWDEVKIHLFYIHGCGDIVHKEANETVEVVIGYGNGLKKDSHTCELWRKNLFVDTYRMFSGVSVRSKVFDGEVYEGKGGGRYAGRDANNMNQYYVKHDNDPSVQSMQLEYPYRDRCQDHLAEASGDLLADIIRKYIVHTEQLNGQAYMHKPVPKFI